MPVSVKNVLMVEKAAGAMAAPMLLASLTPAVVEGKAVLPFSGAEVGRCDRHCFLGEVVVNEKRGEKKTLRHGGAGSVNA